ncbi:MAG: Permease of the drug/metabolite transporter (DMT) superfamily, partial [uncultured Rubrobacteraceae bacterium]
GRARRLGGGHLHPPRGRPGSRGRLLAKRAGCALAPAPCPLSAGGFPARPGSGLRGRFRGGAGSAFRVLDLLARLHERGGERGVGLHPACLCGDTSVLVLRGTYLPVVLLRHPGRARRDGGNLLWRFGRVSYVLRERAGGDRGYNGRRLRPHRSLLTHHGRRRLAVLDRGLRLGRRVARPRGTLHRRAAVGIFERDLVLAVCGDAWAPTLGPHRPQLGAALRRSFHNFRHDPRRTRGLGHARVAGAGREARTRHCSRRCGRPLWPLLAPARLWKENRGASRRAVIL